MDRDLLSEKSVLQCYRGNGVRRMHAAASCYYLVICGAGQRGPMAAAAAAAPLMLHLLLRTR